MARRPSLRTALLVLVMTALVVWAAWGAWASWRLAGAAPMGVHGWIAMGIAAVFTGALAGGLIWLAFYSAREGYDDKHVPRPLGKSPERPHPPDRK